MALRALPPPLLLATLDTAEAVAIAQQRAIAKDYVPGEVRVLLVTDFARADLIALAARTTVQVAER